jgi:hypothetical protein
VGRVADRAAIYILTTAQLGNCDWFVKQLRASVADWRQPRRLV